MHANTVRASLVKFALNTPFIGRHLKLYREYKSMPFQPGHYYSVIPDLSEVEKHEERIYHNNEIKGIDLRIEQQMDLLHNLQQYYASIPYDFTNESLSDSRGYRYKVRDAFYRNSDAIFLHSMIRHFKPKRIIEVGSGHSSAIMMDTNELFFDGSIHMSFVEPFPEERLMAVLRSADHNNTKLIPSFIQDLPLELFAELEENDILFIDSSHVSKIDSDVNHIIFNILPILKPGVLIHFHDIFFPFELPKAWITGRKWFWNENYLLRAFLMHNQDFRIILFNDLLHKRYASWFSQHMPSCLIDAENTGCIWLRKVN